MTSRFLHAVGCVAIPALLVLAILLPLFFPNIQVQSGTPSLALYVVSALLILGALALAIAIRPRYRESRAFDLPQEQLFTVVKSVLKDLGWPFEILGGTEFQAKVPVTGWVSSHNFKVRFPSSGVVEAESRSSSRAEAFLDYGRNRRNVERFFTRVEQAIGRPSRDNA